MSNVVLGLLLLAPMSLYELIKAFDSGVSLFYGASSGSLKRALDALLTQGLIEVAQVESGGRGKETYAITPAGRERFESWMGAPVTEGDAETAMLSRIYFLGLMPREQRGEILDHIEERIVTDLAGLRALQAQVVAQEVRAELADVATHATAVVDFGIGSHQFALEWVRRHRADSP